MQNTNPNKLDCQINIRLPRDMRDKLESYAKMQWTSSSQLARLAVAKELTRLESAFTPEGDLVTEDAHDQQ